ncbi:MAG TPA: flagellar basal body protein [Syntrophorhabdaceae bacterium]|nr:flagellar basal body protein [Syntrophorhabdaceae bacterium]
MDVFDIMEKALNVRSYYHKIIAGNIANAETPGFKEKDIDFHIELEKQLSGAKQFNIIEKTENDGISSPDSNTVNIETQMVKLNENSMMYSALVQLITKKFSMMRYLINEGRR